MADVENINQSLATSRAKRVARGAAVALALFLAIAFGYAAWRFQGLIQPWMAALSSGLAVIGLLSLLAWFAGVFSLVGADSDRQFYDAMTDALTDCCVVTDSKGRAVYANAPYLKLASRAGVARLVGFDVLYSGYSEFSEPVYQLAQAAREGKILHRDVRVVAGSSAPGAKLTAKEARPFGDLLTLPRIAHIRSRHSRACNSSLPILITRRSDFFQLYRTAKLTISMRLWLHG
jgi:hypothetical protein